MLRPQGSADVGMGWMEGGLLQREMVYVVGMGQMAERCVGRLVGGR